MSTNDVPGMNPRNRDELHAGCWAEHEDGTLLYVLGTEDWRVIYELFELNDPRDPVEYRDTMELRKFQKQFSYNASDPKSIKWTWHDKSEFPWNRILETFKPGVRPVSAKKQLAAADRVKKAKRKYAKSRAKTVAQVIAKDRNLAPTPLQHADLQHKIEREMPKGNFAARIRDKLQSAINRLKPGN